MRTNPSRTRRLLGLLSCAWLVLTAGSAAANQVYVDLLTSNHMHDRHLRANFESDKMDLTGWNPIRDRNVDYEYMGDGLGNSWVRENQPKVFEHVFDPSMDVAHIEGAWLTVWLVDDYHGDLHCDAALDCTMDDEYAHIKLGDGDAEWTFYEGGGLNGGSFVLGGVVGSIENVGDSLKVVVEATEGDYRMKGAALAVSYWKDHEGGSQVPEPSAALLFCLGGLLVARRTRRKA